MHVHHIVPKHDGGSDHPWNKTPPIPIHEHSNQHYLRWITGGDEYDFIAYRALSGRTTSEEARVAAAKHGHHLWYSSNPTLASEYASKGGSTGSKTQVTNKIGMFGFSEEQRYSASAKGGQAAHKEKCPITGKSLLAIKLGKSSVETIRTQAVSYTWFHHEFGEVIAPLWKLVEMFPNLQKSNLCKVAKGERSSHKGWSLYA